MPRNTSAGQVSTRLVKGAIAGAVGVWVMDQVGWYLYRRENTEALLKEQKARVGGLDTAHAAANQLAGLAGKRLSPKQPNAAGIAMHYALGMLPGALYAALRGQQPALQAGQGALYGLGLFIVNDELAAPALGWASGPRAYPWQAHARGLVSHVVLGIVTHAVLERIDRRE